MGKKYTQETTIPEPSDEERALLSQLNALVDVELSLQGLEKVDRGPKFVYTKQAEIDELQRQIDALAPTSTFTKERGALTPEDLRLGRGVALPGVPRPQTVDDANANKIRDLQRMQEDLKKEGGKNVNQISYQETPEAAARRSRRQNAADEVETAFNSAALKLAKSDYSIAPETREQINSIIGDNFQKVIDELTVNFGSAEGAIKEATNRLTEAGESQILNAARENRLQLKREAEVIGRSFSDSRFASRQEEFQTGLLSELFKTAAATEQQQIAGLRQTEALTKGQVRQNESAARLDLLLKAAQPLTAFGAGSQFAQLQGALNTQNLQNVLGISGIPQNLLGYMQRDRLAQPTSTSTIPFQGLTLAGNILGMGAEAAQAYFGVQGGGLAFQGGGGGGGMGGGGGAAGGAAGAVAGAAGGLGLF